MSISIQNSTSYAYAAVKTRSVQSQVTVAGDAGSVIDTAPVKQNLGGKINSLEHSATTNARPMFLKGVLQKATGIKVRDLNIEQMDLARSTLSLDVRQAGLQEEDGARTLTSELMHLDSRDMSLAFQGTFMTKAGDSLSFDMQLISSKTSAVYAAQSYQINVPQTEQAQPTEPTGQLDIAA